MSTQTTVACQHQPGHGGRQREALPPDAGGVHLGRVQVHGQEGEGAAELAGEGEGQHVGGAEHPGKDAGQAAEHLHEVRSRVHSIVTAMQAFFYIF